MLTQDAPSESSRVSFTLHTILDPSHWHLRVIYIYIYSIYIYRVIPGHSNHVFDPASVFLSKRDLYSEHKRPKEQETGQIPDCDFYVPVSMSQNDPVYIYTYIYIYISSLCKSQICTTSTSSLCGSQRLFDSESLRIFSTHFSLCASVTQTVLSGRVETTFSRRPGGPMSEDYRSSFQVNLTYHGL